MTEVDAVAFAADDVLGKQKHKRKQKVIETVSKLASLGVAADSTVDHLSPQALALARMASEAKQHRCAVDVGHQCLAERMHTLLRRGKALMVYEHSKGVQFKLIIARR